MKRLPHASFSAARNALVSLVMFHVSLFVAAWTAPAAIPTPAACSPYTFVGRISDAQHVAFDHTNSATLRAYAADGTLLAVETTFFRDDSTRNYALQIPMASSPATGCAITGDVVSVTATDPSGRIWSAVIDPATIGIPGTVSEVDIVLADDADGDGIDDALYQELLDGWYEYAPNPTGVYQPATADTDGDGVSDLDEALLGTNPFDGNDVLAILSFSGGPGNPSISFKATAGHSYAVEQASSLSPDAADWSPVPFATDAAAASASRNLLTTPSSPARSTHTLYLFPTSSPAFFRIAPQ